MAAKVSDTYKAGAATAGWFQASRVWLACE